MTRGSIGYFSSADQVGVWDDSDIGALALREGMSTGGSSRGTTTPSTTTTGSGGPTVIIPTTDTPPPDTGGNGNGSTGDKPAGNVPSGLPSTGTLVTTQTATQPVGTSSMQVTNLTAGTQAGKNTGTALVISPSGQIKLNPDASNYKPSGAGGASGGGQSITQAAAASVQTGIVGPGGERLQLQQGASTPQQLPLGTQAAIRRSSAGSGAVQRQLATQEAMRQTLGPSMESPTSRAKPTEKKVAPIVTSGTGTRPPRTIQSMVWDTLGPNTEKILFGAAVVAVVGGAAYLLRGS